MRSPILLVPFVVLLLGVDGAAKDVKEFQGTWEVVSFQATGKKPTDDDVKKMKVIFKDDVMTLLAFDRVEDTGKFTLDSAKKPKALDFMPTNKKEVAHFIYDLQGDELKLCWRKPGGARPTEFAAKDTDGLIILKRSK